MGDPEKHQCRVCDIIFHSYDELERHCLLHIKSDDPETRFNSEITSTFSVTTTADSVVDSKVRKNLVPNPDDSGNSETKLQDSSNVVHASLLNNIKVEKTDNNVIPGNSVPSIIKIKLEKPDQTVVQPNSQPDQIMVQSDTQPDQTIVQSDPQPNQSDGQSDLEKNQSNVLSNFKQDLAVNQSNPQPSSSNQNGLSGSVTQPLIITRPTEPSEIVLKFPNIFSAISKPPASSQNQPKAPVAKRKQANSVNDKKRVIKRSRLPDTGFACHLCGERFNKKDKLREHMHSHMKEKFLKCDICSEKFLDKTQLDLHRPKHFFRCENCGEGFVKYADLKAHSVKHDSVSKFTCFVCRKSFPYKSVLMAHIDIHNKGAFECDHCFAKFNGRSQLSKHYFAHHSTPKNKTQDISNSVSSGTNIINVNTDNSNNNIHNTTDSSSFQGISIKIKTEVPNQ